MALEEEATKVAGSVMPNPLTLPGEPRRLHQGESEEQDEGSRASFFAPGLAFDPKDSLGLNVGHSGGDQTIGSDESRTYTYFAHPENKETTSLVWDGGNIVTNQRNGLYGAIIVGPKGSPYRDPMTGEDLTNKNAWRADAMEDTDHIGGRGHDAHRLLTQHS